MIPWTRVCGLSKRSALNSLIFKKLRNHQTFDRSRPTSRIDSLGYQIRIKKSRRAGVPKSRFRKLSLRVKRSSLAFFKEIATHLSGARNDMPTKAFPFLNWDLWGIPNYALKSRFIPAKERKDSLEISSACSCPLWKFQQTSPRSDNLPNPFQGEYLSRPPLQGFQQRGAQSP